MFSTITNLFPLRRARLVGRLLGHKGPVTTLAISPNGKLLASGGTQPYGLQNEANPVTSRRRWSEDMGYGDQKGAANPAAALPRERPSQLRCMGHSPKRIL